MEQVREESVMSISRLAKAFDEPRASVGRWSNSRRHPDSHISRQRPVSDEEALREKITFLCCQPRHHTFGHRRIKALLKRHYGLRHSRKTVLRIMDDLGLKQDRIWHRPKRPKRVEKMEPTGPNQAWQIDMTSFQLADLTPLFLVAVVDCYTRQIVGWTLDRRCRASEWAAAVRMALESRGLTTKDSCKDLRLRSDNGAQPCSKKFVEFLGKVGVKGQYTGYNAPDDNAFIERVVRTIKEDEIWPNLYESFSEAWDAIADYMRYYNQERIHSALDYHTPDEVAAKEGITLKAA